MGVAAAVGALGVSGTVGVLGAAAGAASTVYASKKSSSAAKKARNQQANQAKVDRKDSAPYRQAGYSAIPRYQAGIEDLPNAPDLGESPNTPTFETGPNTPSFARGPNAPTLNKFSFNPDQLGQTDAYKFRFNQGRDALDLKSGASRMLNSGNRLAELTGFGQDMASQEYENEFGRQFSQYGADNDRLLSQYNADLTGAQDERSRLQQDYQNRFTSAQDRRDSLQQNYRNLFARSQDNVTRKMSTYGANTDRKNTISNRLAALMGIGQTTNNQASERGQQYAANAGNAAIAEGEARASGILGVGNTINNGLSVYAYGQGRGGGGSFQAPNFFSNNPWANPLVGGPKKLVR